MEERSAGLGGQISITRIRQRNEANRESLLCIIFSNVAADLF